MRSLSAFRNIVQLGVFVCAPAALLMGSLASNVVHAEEQSAEQEQEGEAGVRYTRKSKKAKAKSGLIETKFKKAQKEEQNRKKRPPKQMSARDFAKKKEAVAQEMADRQIEMVVRLLKSTDKGDSEYPDLLFRLADHYLDKKAYFDNQSTSLYDKIYDAEDNKQRSLVKQLKDQQKRLAKQSRDSSKKAANVYAALVADPAFAKYSRMDEALYYYAFELGQLGQEAEMQKTYQRLINDFPDSQYISQAYLAFADYYYGKDNIQAAARLYEKVTEFKDSPVYAYALYKLGWCHLNPIGTAEARYDRSLDYFVKTIQATIDGRAGSEENGRQLRRDTRRDLVRAYVHASKPSKAQEFFAKWGKGPGKKEDDQKRMLLLLANQYFGEGKYSESTYIYKKMQQQFATSPERCSWQSKIFINTLAADDKSIQWLEVEKMGEFWNEYKTSDKYKKSAKKLCHDEAVNTMKMVATTWHDEAQKTLKHATYELAEKAYSAFLSTFPKDKDAYELQYYYAELLWSLAENYYGSKDEKTRKKGLDYFLRAHDQFLKSLKLNPKGKFTQDAAYAQMLAMKNHLEYDETGGKAKACKTDTSGECIYREKKKKKVKRDKNTKTDAAAEYPETDYTPQEKKMLSSYDTYTKYVKSKKDKELPKIMFHRAKLMMEHNKFAEAKPILEAMVEKFDGSLYAAWCSEMLLDLLTIQWTNTANTPQETIKAGDELETWAKKMKKMKLWNHPEAERVRDGAPLLLAGIGWKKAEAFRDSGAAWIEGKPGGDQQGFRKCTDQYLQVYYDFEKHDRADDLLFNAAICAEAGYQISNAIKIRGELLSVFPESKHAKDTLYALAESNQAVAYYSKSAEHYEKFAEKYRSDKRTSGALQNAYLFRLGLGETEQANQDLKKFESMYKKKDTQKAAGIFWTRYKTLSKDEDKIDLAKDYLKVYGKRGGTDRVVVAEAAIGEILWRQSCPKPLVYDSCLSIERKRALSGSGKVEERKKIEAKSKNAEARKRKSKYKVPKRCGSDKQAVVTAYERDKKKAQEAQKHFAAVLKLAGRSKIDIPKEEKTRVDDFKNAWGMAVVYQADKQYEEYLRLEMPSNMSFQVEEWRKGQGIPAWDRIYKKQVKARDESMKRMQEYSKAKDKMAAELTKKYAAVVKAGSPYWLLAGAARTAMLFRNFADQLYRAEVPNTLKTEDDFFSYCDALEDLAKPYADKAFENFNYCISQSTKYQYFNVYSRLCESEMQQWDPDKYPATNEAFGVSTYTRSRIAVAPVMTNSTGEQFNKVRRGKGSGKAKSADNAEKGSN